MTWLHRLMAFFKKLINGTTTTTTTTTTKGSYFTKNAICIGINDYPGSQNDLHGCINDARAWKSMLENKGFAVSLVLDSDATINKITTALEKLVAQAEKGHELFITYSGHGSNVRDTSGDEDDGRDETWYLYDGNLLDDKIREILSKLPAEVKLTVISDSCHSGTITRAFLAATAKESHGIVPPIRCKARYMPPEDEIEATSLASLAIKKQIFYPEEGMNHVLISGCMSTEYSYDASFNGKPMGAFSHYALLVLRDNPLITYNDFYTKLRRSLPSDRYPQTPCLEGSDKNKSALIF